MWSGLSGVRHVHGGGSAGRRSHAGLHEDPETFNRATLDFLLRQRS